LLLVELLSRTAGCTHIPELNLVLRQRLDLLVVEDLSAG
jgi:hypothetical protein